MKWDDILLEIAWKRHDEAMTDKREVETKASFILAANGVILGLIVNGSPVLWTPLALLAVVFLVASILLCALSLKIREYRTLKPKRVLKFFDEQENSLVFKRELFKELADNEVFNTKQVNKSAGLLQYGIYSFVVTVLLLATSFFIHILS